LHVASVEASPKENGFRLIKLLAADTCEESFLFNSTEKVTQHGDAPTSENYPVPMALAVELFGSFTSPKASGFLTKTLPSVIVGNLRSGSQETFTFTDGTF
jgi:hypothetical protein